MDPGRYVLQPGWDTNSALEGYGSVLKPDYRGENSYGERRYLDDAFPREDEVFSREGIYQRNTFHHDQLERETYPSTSPSIGAWPPHRRHNFDEDMPPIRENRRHNSFHEVDGYHNADKYHEMGSFREGDKHHDGYHEMDRYRPSESYRDYGFHRSHRLGPHDHDAVGCEDYEYRRRVSREDSRERDYNIPRHHYDSDHERRDSSWHRRDRDKDRHGTSREREHSPQRRLEYSRSRSRGRDDRIRSRSPRGRSHSRSHKEDSYEDGRYDRSDRHNDWDDRRHNDSSSVVPSATIVVKGLSQKTTEEDLYQILAEWGPVRHVRVIKERNSGISRGFAFIDFHSVEAAKAMMIGIGNDGLVVDGRKLFFEYSSKPTGSLGSHASGSENAFKAVGHGGRGMIASDWMCTMCACVNFARRTSCFQCNEVRADDAPAADVVASNPTSLGRKGSDAGPTHVLVVRGLDENADEEMLRYEFSKHAPIKDIRLVRDKFTHVSRGFGFVHFYSVDDATRALEATNGTMLEKNGQILRVAYAKSIHGPGSGASSGSQASSLAAAAIEAAAFAQQFDSAGWAPKEYNPDDKQQEPAENKKSGTQSADGSAVQSGFVWDEASGYYYDASSGFYYDGNTGLYYDGNSGTWYTFDQQTQQYMPCANQNDTKASSESTEATKADGSSHKKVVISAPAITTSLLADKKPSLADAVQAAANAALAAEKKEKEKEKKEIKLASKSSILANKKKMSNVLSMWKQRNHEGQGARVVLDDDHSAVQSSSTDDRLGKLKSRSDIAASKDSLGGITVSIATTQATNIDVPSKPQPVSNSLGGTLMGVIRGSGKGIVKSDTFYEVGAAAPSSLSSPLPPPPPAAPQVTHAAATPFRTDASALGAYAPPSGGGGKRRFSETPGQVQKDQQPQTTYRDRAAERRSLYGSSSGNSSLDPELDSRTLDVGGRGKGPLDSSMPFPPGVGSGRAAGAAMDMEIQSYDVITADKAIDESNVGNKMLRSMGWQEGSGLGKDGSGIVEPVQAQSMGARAGLGSQKRKPTEQWLEAQPGDTYKAIIQKKAMARFRDMS